MAVIKCEVNQMTTKYPNLFTPLTIGKMVMKNRTAMMPMGTNYGEQNGEMSFLHIKAFCTSIITSSGQRGARD